MPDKLVFVKTLTTAKDKHDKNYLKAVDQDNVSWNIFGQATKVEVNKAYLFTFETTEAGYDNVSAIKPVTNIFHQKALKEVANKNDTWRQCSMVFSYSKDLVVGGQIRVDDIFTYADKIYDYLQEKTNEIFGGEKSDV